MANDTQDEPSRNSIVGRSVISPPPPYTSIDLKNDNHHHRQTVDDTVSKMQEVIENTYLMMQDLQNRLIRLECSNQLFATSSVPRIQDNNGSSIRDDYHSTNYNDYTDILDTMTQTVQQLLQEAQASLNRTITLPSTAGETMEAIPSATFDQQSRYNASERKLDRTFELLMDQVCNTNFSNDGANPVPTAHSEKLIKDLPSPVGGSIILDYHYHHHHHHHHHYHDDYSPLSTPLPGNAAASSGMATSTIPIDHSDYARSTSSGTTNTMLSTATTKSVQLVQSWLSPLHRLTSLSPPPHVNNHPPPSISVLLPLSPSASTTTSASLSSAQGGIGHQQQHYYARLYRIIWILLITSRLLLDQHFRSPASFLHYNIHLLRPRHRQLWYRYKSSLLGSSTASWSTLCRQMSRFIFITQFIYHIIST